MNTIIDAFENKKYTLEDFLVPFKPVAKSFMVSQAMMRIAKGDITLAHYKSVLRQIFHHTRENPQLQALATVHFRGAQREMIKRFYQHAASEYGHDQLALNDLKVLGEDTSKIPTERPIPATSALLAFGFYQVQNLNPIGYLGYLFFLEFLPTQQGKLIMNKLSEVGVPQEAMSFIKDHSTIDLGHNKMMEAYIACLVQRKADFEAVVYAMRVTGKLYADMIQEAFEQVDAPEDWGVSYEEVWSSL